MDLEQARFDAILVGNSRAGLFVFQIKGDQLKPPQAPVPLA
jgi:hypothetical protein